MRKTESECTIHGIFDGERNVHARQRLHFRASASSRSASSTNARSKRQRRKHEAADRCDRGSGSIHVPVAFHCTGLSRPGTGKWCQRAEAGEARSIVEAAEPPPRAKSKTISDPESRSS